jgi:hypothetical protein
MQNTATEPIEVTLARGHLAEAGRKPVTIYAALISMARAELNTGANSAAIQWVLADLTAHLSTTERATWWFELKHSLDEAAPPCGVRPRPDFDPATEDYDTRLTTALRMLAGQR